MTFGEMLDWTRRPAVSIAINAAAVVLWSRSAVVDQGHYALVVDGMLLAWSLTWLSSAIGRWFREDEP